MEWLRSRREVVIPTKAELGQFQVLRLGSSGTFGYNLAGNVCRGHPQYYFPSGQVDQVVYAYPPYVDPNAGRPYAAIFIELGFGGREFPIYPPRLGTRAEVVQRQTQVHGIGSCYQDRGALDAFRLITDPNMNASALTRTLVSRKTPTGLLAVDAVVASNLQASAEVKTSGIARDERVMHTANANSVTSNPYAEDEGAVLRFTINAAAGAQLLPGSAIYDDGIETQVTVSLAEISEVLAPAYARLQVSFLTSDVNVLFNSSQWRDIDGNMLLLIPHPLPVSRRFVVGDVTGGPASPNAPTKLRKVILSQLGMGITSAYSVRISFDTALATAAGLHCTDQITGPGIPLTTAVFPVVPISVVGPTEYTDVEVTGPATVVSHMYTTVALSGATSNCGLPVAVPAFTLHSPSGTVYASATVGKKRER